MFKDEFQQLNPFDRLDAVIAVVVTIAMMAAAYFLDGARIAAFGMMPALGLLSYADRRGIRVKTTPRLFGALCLVALAMYAGSVYWVTLYPKH